MKKDLLLAFVVGIFMHKLQNKLGDWLLDPIYNYIVADLENFPRISHYLNNHDAKRSFNCDQCRLGTPVNVDSLS